jgi:Asp-tRNA(Asn)/Glu-tRNA(Gln) amidotransferase A subunit family amidase
MLTAMTSTRPSNDLTHPRDLDVRKSSGFHWQQIVCTLLLFAALFVQGTMSHAATFQLIDATIADINDAFDAGILTSERLTELYLNRIEAYDEQGPILNSIITLNPDALTTARALDAERQSSGPRSLLHGVPILVKDNFDTFDMPTTAGALALEDSVPPDDAFMIGRLRDAGALILGKANLSEFAVCCAGQATSSLGGQTRNPYDPRRNPGESSAGTGAAIAANFATVGLGTDTGGSIRIPSAFESLVGLKPTMGLVSRDGLIPLTLTRDVPGPMARSVADVAIVLDLVAGFDEADPVTATSQGRTPNTYLDSLQRDGLRGARIGVMRQFIGADTDQEVIELLDEAINDITALGAEIIDPFNIGRTPNLISTFYVSFEFDMNNYLDSLGAGAPFESVQELVASREYHPDMRSKFTGLRGDIAPEEDSLYQSIARQRDAFTEDILDAMAAENLDAVLYPTVNHPAPPLGDGYLAEVLLIAPLIGFPAITVPAGFTAEGLPVGVEFLGRPFSEPTLLRLAYSYEQATRHRRPPDSVPPLLGEIIAMLEAGDANQDLLFDQLDLVQVQVAGKYLTGLPATWGEGDWNGAPGGSPGQPPIGDGVFDQLDIVAAQKAGFYLTGAYAVTHAEALLAPVPEPSSLLILIAGLGVLQAVRWRAGTQLIVIT